MRKRIFRLSIDFWSVPHFLAGAVTGLAAAAFSWNPFAVFFATFALAVVWEFFEKSVKIGEDMRNVVSDIALPLVAFPATYLFAARAVETSERRLALLTVVTLVYAYTNVLAWNARSQHDDDFTNDQPTRV